MATIQLASPHELLEATFRERRRRGWDAVAPELEPHLDAQRWPNGVPLSEDFRPHVARHTRLPRWMPDLRFAVWMLVLGACVFYGCSGPSFLHTSTNLTCMEYGGYTYINACRLCMLFAVCVVSVWTLLAYVCLGGNKAVQRHVNSLYVLYALGRTDPSLPRALIYDVDLRPGAMKALMNIRVFADGTFDMRKKVLVHHQLTPQESNVGCGSYIGHTSGALHQHACNAQHRQCRHRQLSTLCGSQVQLLIQQAILPHSIPKECPSLSGK